MQHTQISTVIMSEVLQAQPTDPVKFVADYMTEKELKERVIKTANTIGVI